MKRARELEGEGLGVRPCCPPPCVLSGRPPVLWGRGTGTGLSAHPLGFWGKKGGFWGPEVCVWPQGKTAVCLQH